MHFRLRTRSLVLSAALALPVAAPSAVLLAPSAAVAQDAEAPELRVTEIVTSRGYEGGQAVDATTSFRRTDGRVYVVIRLENPTSTETDITVTFERGAGEATSGGRGGVTLHVPASRRYRTVARTSTSRPAGHYRAVVRNSEGEVIGQVEFDITE